MIGLRHAEHHFDRHTGIPFTMQYREWRRRGFSLFRSRPLSASPGSLSFVPEHLSVSVAAASSWTRRTTTVRGLPAATIRSTRKGRASSDTGGPATKNLQRPQSGQACGGYASMVRRTSDHKRYGCSERRHDSRTILAAMPTAPEISPSAIRTIMKSVARVSWRD